jgi:D-sedoheptulose 7-phosphate isomerase
VEIRTYFSEVQTLIDKTPFAQVEAVVEALMQANQSGQTVFICGNGGSAATATHFGCDLSKRPLVEGQPRFRVIALTDNNSLITAIANDMSYEAVFSEQIKSLGRKDDLLIGISGSGNSKNVLNAVSASKELGIKTVGFSGYDGGKLAPMVDISVHIPSFNMAMVEDVHLMLEHAICEKLLALRQVTAAPVSALNGHS